MTASFNKFLVLAGLQKVNDDGFLASPKNNVSEHLLEA
jgi:hypothetical protein